MSEQSHTGQRGWLSDVFERYIENGPVRDPLTLAAGVGTFVAGWGAMVGFDGGLLKLAGGLTVALGICMAERSIDPP